MDEIEQLKTEVESLRAVIHGGTEAVPVGLKSKVAGLADDLAEIDTPATRKTLMMLEDGVVQQLVKIDPVSLRLMETEIEMLRRADVQRMRDCLTRLESNEITDGRTRFAQIETHVTGLKKALWLLATGVVMALIRSAAQLF